MLQMEESAVPEQYCTTSGNKCQLRLLDNFIIHEDGKPQSVVPIESLRSKPGFRLVATGELLPANGGDAGARRIAVVTGTIVDWCLEYGDRPGVWIMTNVAWYHLVNPSPTYASVYRSLQTRKELAIRCAAALQRQPDAAVEEIQQLVLSGGSGIGSSGQIFGLQQLYDEAPFLAAQMTALYEAGRFSQQQQSAFMPSFLAWLKRQASILAAQASQQAAAAAAAEARAAKRQRLHEAGPPSVVAVQAAGLGNGTVHQQQQQEQHQRQAATGAMAATPHSAAAATPAGSSSKPTKLKFSLHGAPAGTFKPKIKLKGQILPQAQPPPQDMGSQIQGQPPGAEVHGGIGGQHNESSGQQPSGFKPKLKLMMPKGFMRNSAGASQAARQQQGAQQQQQQSQLPPAPPMLQHQHSLQESKASWGGPPQPQGQLQQQQPWEYEQQQQQQQHMQQQQYQQYDQYDQYGGGYSQYHQYHQQPQYLTAKQQKQAAALAARQAAAAARAAAAAARAEEAERRRREQELQLQMKRQAEYTADIARGMPPLPTRTFRLPAAYVPELLQLWELCQAFGAALGIPPFSLDQLEAALLPGPLTEQQKQASGEVTFAAADAEASAAAQKAAADLAAAIAEAQAAEAAQHQPAAAAAAEQQLPDVQGTATAGGAQQQQAVAAGVPAVPAVQAAAGQPPTVAKVEHAPVEMSSDNAVAQAPATAGDVAVTDAKPTADKDLAAVQPAADIKQEQSEPQQQQWVKQEQGEPQQQQTQQQQQQVATQEAAGQQQLHQAAASVQQPADAHRQEQQVRGSTIAGAANHAAVQQATESANVVQGPTGQQQEQQQQQALSGPVQQRNLVAAEQQHQQLSVVSPAAAGAAEQVVGDVAAAAAAITGQERQQAEQPHKQQEALPQQELQQIPAQQQATGTQLEQQHPNAKQQLQQQAVTDAMPAASPANPAAAAAAPASSVTSLGTACQAGVSNSVGGVTGSSPNKSMKLKLKLGSLSKQGSSAGAAAAAAEPAAAGTAGATAPGVVATAAADSAAAAAHAAAATAAAGTVHPAAATAAAGANTTPGAFESTAAAAAAAASGAGWCYPDAAAAAGQPAFQGLTLESAAAAAAAAEAEDIKQQVDVGIADRLSLASSLLMRDVHTALLRLIDGTAPKPSNKRMRQPLTAKMCPPEGLKQQAVVMAQPHWACRVAYILAAATGIDRIEPGVQDIADQLLAGNYASLPLDSRLAVLRALLELALASETFHAHLDARIEAYTAPKPLRAEVFRAFAGNPGAVPSAGVGRGRGGYRGHHGADGEAGPSEEAKRTAAEKHDRGTAGRMLEEWMEWLSTQEQQSMGCRVPVGVDYRQRRYWVLGGAAGAWRLYCEEKDGQLWGYYEGEQLLHLAHWVACAAIEAELPLLHTLCTMPWPYRPSLVLMSVASAASAAAAAAGAEAPETPRSVAYWAAIASGSNGYGYGAYHFTPVEAGVVPLGPQLFAGLCVPHAQQLMSAWEMAKYRPDGYRGMLAPLLAGEADVPGGSMLPSSEARLQAGVVSLVSAVPFYLPGQQQLLQQLGQVMDQAQATLSLEAYTSVLLSLESLMSHPQLEPAPLHSSWVSTWQQQWRDSLARCGPSSWEALVLHLAMLGRHVVLGRYAMGREGFMRIVTSSRCPLVFPSIGDEYMIVRSAAELHLDKYMQLPDAATAPLPPAAAELGAAAEVLARLPPVSCYKVVGVAYCSYPMPEALRQQQRPPLSETAAATAVAAAGGGFDDVTGPEEEAAAAAGTSITAAAAGAAAAAAVGLHKHNSIAAAFSDDDDIGGLLDFDVDELMKDVANLEQQPGAQRLASLPLPPLPPELQHHAAADTAVGRLAGSTAAADPPQQQQDKVPPPPGNSNAAGPPEYRPPCMWALLSPVVKASIGNGTGQARRTSEPDFLLPERFQQQHDELDTSTTTRAADEKASDGRPYIALPFHVDAYLPDFLVPPEHYEAGVERSWLPGDRFSMRIGTQARAGVFAASKGTIMSVDEGGDGEEYDPWESITVLWDNDDDDSEHKVSPWEIEPDQDEINKAAEEARKAEAAAAATAAEASRQQGSASTAAAAADDGVAGDDSSLRGGRRRASRNIDLSSLIGAVDDDDEYNPFADGYSSDSDDGGRRRKGKGKGSGLTWGGDRGAKGSKRGREEEADFAAAAGGDGPSSKKGGGRGGGTSRALAGAGGNLWNMEQIKQQQGAHLTHKQQQMLAALHTGNTALLAQLTATLPNVPIHEQPYPTPLKADCLASLPCKTSFITLVADYNMSLRGGFNAPMWGNRELDLYTLFMVVNVRGGYEAVCRTNRWADVCRSMGLYKDPSSADAMRKNYETASLVQFEQYVRRGGWEQDRHTARRPQASPDDQKAAVEQVMRAGAAAAAAPPPPPPPPPVPAIRPQATQLIALPPQFATLPMLTQPGGPKIVGLQAGTGQVIVAATPAQFQALQLQLRLLAQQKGKAPGAAGAPAVVIPAAAGAAPGAPGLTAPVQPAQAQLLLQHQLLQRAQLQSAAAAAGAGVQVIPGAAANPQLQALLQQQQQLQKASAVSVRPPVAGVGATLSGGLTLQQLQQLQQQQLKPNAAAVGQPGAVVALPSKSVAPATNIALPRVMALPGAAAIAIRPAAAAAGLAGGLVAPTPGPVTAAPAPAGAQPTAQQALAGTGSINFSALLGDD